MKKQFNWRLAILPILNLMVIMACLPFLPDQIPMHFNLQWEVDAYGSRESILLMPFLLIGLWLLYQLMPIMDPLGKNYEKFKSRYEQTFIVLSLFIIGMEVMMILMAYSIDFIKPELCLQVMMGVLFMVLGNIFPKIKHNYFVGIKTPWTIHDANNWTMTHRLGGKCWFIGGFLAIVFVVLPKPWRSIVLFVDLCLITIIPIVYSYIYFKEKRGL